MKHTKGLLSVRVFADCPHCDKQMDLMEHAYNDEGQVADIIFNRSFFENKTQLDLELVCEHCETEFRLIEIEY